MTEKECKHCDFKNHTIEENEEKLEKKDIILYIISIILFLLTFVPVFNKYKVWIYLLVDILSGYKLIFKGIKNIFKLNFEEDTLMTIAVIAAFILGEYPESCMVILLFKLGEFLEDKAVEKSNKNIKDIVEIKAKTANLIDEYENIEIVDVEKIKVNDIILIKPGEMIPLDCKIIKGTSSLDMSSITGESIPVEVKENESILSGSINLNRSLTCIVEKDYKDSTVSQIVDLVNEAKNNKGKIEEFITKFSKIYTPIVIGLAIIIAILPPLILNQEFKKWIMRALVFLVASCPCSIVISVPLAFFSCIGKISKKGMLIKGTKHIESLANAKYVTFDKTGTLTTGKMQIEKLVSIGKYTDDELLKYMYALEKNSNHPISTAIKQKIEKENIKVDIIAEECEEIAGHGIKAKVEEKQILFGNEKLLEVNNIKDDIKKNASYIIIDGKLEGYITFKEEIRKDVDKISENLKKINIKETIMLTGDNEDNANKILKIIGLDKIYAGLLPQEKLEKVKELKKDGKVIFIGDGINDSPVLAEADFGISMGEGTEIANSTADAIIISNNIGILPNIIKIAKKTMRIIKFNISFSLIVKAVVLILGVLGYAPVWLAIIADTGVSLLTVLNSMRIYK